MINVHVVEYSNKIVTGFTVPERTNDGFLRLFNLSINQSTCHPINHPTNQSILVQCGISHNNNSTNSVSGKREKNPKFQIFFSKIRKMTLLPSTRAPVLTFCPSDVL